MVTMTYFGENPAGKDATWRANNKLTCTPGLGVPVVSELRPAHGRRARRRGARARDDRRRPHAGDRLHVPGDQQQHQRRRDLRARRSSTACRPAARRSARRSATWTPSQCGADDPRQLWTYATDYGIHLSVSDLSATPLCMTGNSSAATGFVGRHADAVHGGQHPAEVQLAGWRAGGGARRTTTPNYSSKCLVADAAYSDADLIGKKLKYGTCWPATTSPTGPSTRTPASVRVRPARRPSQIVNFLEFGRCMDVTGENVIDRRS